MTEQMYVRESRIRQLCCCTTAGPELLRSLAPLFHSQRGTRAEESCQICEEVDLHLCYSKIRKYALLEAPKKQLTFPYYMTNQMDREAEEDCCGSLTMGSYSSCRCRILRKAKKTSRCGTPFRTARLHARCRRRDMEQKHVSFPGKLNAADSIQPVDDPLTDVQGHSMLVCLPVLIRRQVNNREIV